MGHARYPHLTAKNELDAANLGDQNKLVESGGTEMSTRKIQIASVARPREGWGEKFRLMSDSGKDQLIEELNVQTQWEKDEWEW